MQSTLTPPASNGNGHIEVADVAEMAASLRLFVAPGGIGEVRVIGSGKSQFGFFFRHDEIDTAALHAATYNKKAKGVYVVMNRISTELADRPRLCKQFKLTTDENIAHRRNLMIDFDPSSAERGANDSATDAEKEAARKRMEEVFEWLRDLGFPEPIFADSGNGFHMLFALDLPNDEESHRLISNFLLALSKRFGDDQVTVDISVHNASRITKLYGTVAKKGQNREDRPHRLSRLLTVPEGIGVVSAELIVEATKAVLAEATPATADASLFDRPATANPRINNDAHTPTTPKLILPETFPVGGRHDTLLKVAGAVRSFGSTETEILAILRTFNRTRCGNGKPDDELVKIARDYSTKDTNLSMKALIEGPSAATTRRILPVGTRVKAADQDNVGDVVNDNGGPTITVHFVSPSGVHATKDLAVGLLTLADGSPVVPDGFRLNFISSREFAVADYRQEFDIRHVLVKRQPCIIGGPLKGMKTGVMIEMAVSLGSATPFLGREEFAVKEAVNVAIISGESGLATLQETARRIAEAHNIELADCKIFWETHLPKIANPEHRDALRSAIRGNGIKTCFLDPAYLCLLSGDTQGRQASNVFDMGSILQGLADVGQDTGCGIVLAHHMRKNPAEKFAIPDLTELAYAGFGEFARQWILLNRRSEYEPGRHEMWLSIGGSAGHSSCWSLDIEEGVPDEEFRGRYWRTSVRPATEAIRQKRDDRDRQKENDRHSRMLTHLERLAELLRKAVEPMTKNEMRDALGLNDANFKIAFAEALNRNLLSQTTKKSGNGRTYDAFQIQQSDSRTN